MSKPTRTMRAPLEMIAFVAEINEVVGRHAKLKGDLAIAGLGQVIGNLIALQDGRKMSGSMAMRILAANVQIGNANAIAKLSKLLGGNA